jgi:hypothetical protein
MSALSPTAACKSYYHSGTDHNCILARQICRPPMVNEAIVHSMCIELVGAMKCRFTMQLLLRASHYHTTPLRRPDGASKDRISVLGPRSDNSRIGLYQRHVPSQ